MNQKHRALVVEDEAEAAADLAEILTTCGCESVVVTNRRDALEQLDRGAFCIILLDLEIRSVPDSIRGRVDHGKLFLREARCRYPELVGTKYALPIVVLSGFASETEEAVAVMKEGASDVVQKLSSVRNKADRIQEALETAGRPSHRVCADRGTAVRDNPRSELTLSISGEQEGRRVVVQLGSRTAKLTQVALKVLLHLLKARVSNSSVHKTDLGARDDRGFRSVSVLRDQLAAACEGPVKELIKNDQHGNYSLADRVVPGSVDTARLERLGDREITKLAREIHRLSAAMEESAGKG